MNNLEILYGLIGLALGCWGSLLVLFYIIHRQSEKINLLRAQLRWVKTETNRYRLTMLDLQEERAQRRKHSGMKSKAKE